MSPNVSEGTLTNSRSQKLLRLLGFLKETPAGKVLYDQISLALSDSELAQAAWQDAWIALVSTLLELYEKPLPGNGERKIQLRLLRDLLAPPMSVDDIEALRHSVQQIGVSKTKVETSLSDVVMTPLRRTRVVESVLKVELGPRGDPKSRDVDWVTSAGANVPTPNLAAGDGTAHGATGAEADERSEDGESQETSYRNHLNYTYTETQKLQSELIQKIRSMVAPHTEITVTINRIQDVLREIGDDSDLNSVRERLMGETEIVAGIQQEMVARIEDTLAHLQTLQNKSQYLADELARVHLLSLTDELSGLPNRRAFMRHLQDEISWVQRYNSPLCLALIDLDHFKDVNDQYGHAAGDAVLSTYSKQVLSIFRHHDLVARFGGEEFAVILPNTSMDGAVSALNKVVDRARASRFRWNDEIYPVPTMSVGLVQFRTGETPVALIERADQMLYRAKNHGRDRLEADAAGAE